MEEQRVIESREHLLDCLTAAGLGDEAEAIATRCEREILKDPVNAAALERFNDKCIRGERIEESDVENLTVDRELLLTVLGALLVPRIRARHAELGLPADVTEESCLSIGNGCRVLKGYPRVLSTKLGWLGKYGREVMFKSGLFVYRVAPLSEKLPVLALRERNTGRMAAVANQGLAVDEKGLICPEGERGAFVTSLTRTPQEIAGYQVRLSVGRISGERLSFGLDRWEILLEPGALTAEIHIPPGRRMELDACRHSLYKTAEVLRHHLPPPAPACITCMSWILSPEWLELLPDSNMAAFMREGYLFPIKAPPTIGVNCVFRKPAAEVDPATAQRSTRLQRIMLERLEKKEPLYGGGMFIPLEDAIRYGAQPRR